MEAIRILQQAKEITESIVAWRRDIHRWPELGFHEERTAALAAEVLEKLGCCVRRGVGITGVLGDMGTGSPMIALRADMDALPIQEETGLEFQSECPGIMHACGHDAHVAMLLGAATLLSRQAFTGTVRFILQPSEESADAEGLSGAARMIQDGAMEGVDAVFGLHVITELPTGMIGLCPGPVQAAADTLRLRVSGKGSHAAQPHMGRDTIFIAAQIVSGLQSVVARTVNPLDSVVISLGTINGGTRGNIIPQEVNITGTIRTLDRGVRERVREEVARVASGIAVAFGGSCQVEIETGYPVTVNTPTLTAMLRDVAESMLGCHAVVEIEPSMGAEDFSLLAAESKGCFFRLGITPEGHEPSRGHSATFMIDEDALPVGTAMLAACALRYMAEAAEL